MNSFRSCILSILGSWKPSCRFRICLLCRNRLQNWWFLQLCMCLIFLSLQDTWVLRRCRQHRYQQRLLVNQHRTYWKSEWMLRTISCMYVGLWFVPKNISLFQITFRGSPERTLASRKMGEPPISLNFFLPQPIIAHFLFVRGLNVGIQATGKLTESGNRSKAISLSIVRWLNRGWRNIFWTTISISLPSVAWMSCSFNLTLK